MTFLSDKLPIQKGQMFAPRFFNTKVHITTDVIVVVTGH